MCVKKDKMANKQKHNDIMIIIMIIFQIQDGDPCSRLWCRFEYQSTTTCVMRNKPAADGTYCKHAHVSNPRYR